MSGLDRIIRTVIALALIILWATKVLTGAWLIVGLVVAAIFLVTSIISFCPLYRLFGKNFGTKRPSSPTPPPTPTI